MNRNLVRTLFFSLAAVIGIGLLIVDPVQADAVNQQPTVSIATVTGTPSGPTIRVNTDEVQVNVRTGPGTNYVKIGVIVSGQIIPALGKSSGGLWIYINYPGVPGGVAWVYSPLVTIITGGELSIIEPPPTPTPLVTPTIDPTLASQFVLESPATRLPTYTPPAPLTLPTMTSNDTVGGGGVFPMGLAILLLGVFGIMGILISVVRGR